MNNEPTFIETIKLQYRKLHNLDYHNARANRTRQQVLGIHEPIDLADHISIPEDIRKGLYRCRVTYGHDIQNVEIEPYRRKRIKSLKLVSADDLYYGYKYADRSRLDELFEMRGKCDDILMVKDGKITDTSYANVVFFDGEAWYTPDTPLLKGTKRQQLVDEGMIRTISITADDLSKFRSCVVINAMRGFVPRSAFPVAFIVGDGHF